MREIKNIVQLAEKPMGENRVSLSKQPPFELLIRPKKKKPKNKKKAESKAEKVLAKATALTPG